MSKRRMIESIAVANPCTKAWDEMAGNDQVRFCTHCEKSVTDLSSMRRKDALRLVRSSGGKLCVRYVEHPKTKEPLFAERLIQISRRAPTIAAGVMGASISLASLTYAQGDGRLTRTPANQETAALRPADDQKTAVQGRGSLSGTMVDPVGAVIPGGQIYVKNDATGTSRTVATDASGQFSFNGIDAGSYTITATAPGFKRIVIERVAVNENANTDQTVRAEARELYITTGVVAISVTEYRSLLSSAIQDDEPETVRDLIANGANVNEREEDGTTPMFAAVERGNFEIVRMLVEQGARVNARNDEKQTPLMRLDDDSPPELAEYLLNAGAKVNAVDKEGSTALMKAAKYASAEIVRLLINAGADVNAADKKGWTALMHAAYGDDLEKVRLLLNAGAEVNAKNDEGETAWDQTTNEEVEDLLVAHGAIVDDSDDADDDEAPEESDEPPSE